MEIKGVKLDYTRYPPVLRMSIFGAPHRRQDNNVLMDYRQKLNEACRNAGIDIPIDDVLDLEILFINGCTPNLDNLITAFYRAVDGKSLKGLSVLTDDGLIQSVKMSKFYSEEPRRCDNRIP